MSNRFQEFRSLSFADGHIVWRKDYGMGYYPVKDFPYDDNYFKKYESYHATVMGARILEYRMNLVDHYIKDDDLVDIGIGCGAFCRERGYHTFGYDVNPVGIEWLNDHKLYFDPYFKVPESISCWDSLEHIQYPERLIERVQRFIFVSIPIFRNLDHVLKSKHYRKDEHYWYFTRDGLRDCLAEYDFKCLENSATETRYGREDIETFVFKRR